MGSGFTKMKKQAKLMQSQMSQMREQIANKSVQGTAGAGLVTVTINGEKLLKNIVIKPECVNPSDVEGLQDLILAAFKDASDKLDSEMGSIDLFRN